MKYVYIFAVALVVWLALPTRHFYITPPDAVMVNQLATIRADRTSKFDGGTIEITLPPSFTGLSAGLINDPGPCTIDNNHVVCYPSSGAATLYVFGRAGPHTSPVIIHGQATSPETLVIGDTVQLTLGGVLSSYFPTLVR